MKKRCLFCHSSQTERRGLRKGKERYYCRNCKKWFQINRVAPRIASSQLLMQHLDGTSFRSLSNQHSISVGSAYNYCSKALKELPTCIDVTRYYCQKFQGVLLTDGKYLKVKSYDRKIPVIYGIDYQTHDIPHYRLCLAENYLSCKKFFSSLKLTNYVLQALVCDDNNCIYSAAKYVYPQVVVQLCHLHFLRNMKTLLDLENSQLHKLFFNLLCRLLIQKRAKEDFDKKAANLVTQFNQDKICSSILIELARKQPLLQGYLNHKGTPTTTNLIESFNSHLESRIKPLKGFESFKHANLWLNAYFLRRRTKKFTDCTHKFNRLNGKTSLEISKKCDIDLPSFF